jgi:glutamate-1-semialdehyde 2,1-aminomutase
MMGPKPADREIAVTVADSLDRARLERLMSRELAAFATANPRSAALFERARGSLLAGVPMNWMVKWAGGSPLFVAEASGARFRDVDGHEYIDFCLGDTGAMAGHGPAETRRKRSPG